MTVSYDALFDVLEKARRSRVTAARLLEPWMNHNQISLGGDRPLLLKVLHWLSAQGVTGKWSTTDHDNLFPGANTTCPLHEGAADLGEWITAVDTICRNASEGAAGSPTVSLAKARSYLSPFIFETEVSFGKLPDDIALLDRGAHLLANFAQQGLLANRMKLEAVAESLKREVHVACENIPDSNLPALPQSAADMYKFLLDSAAEASRIVSCKLANQAEATDAAILRVVTALGAISRHLEKSGSDTLGEFSPVSDEVLSGLVLTAVESCHVELAAQMRVISLSTGKCNDVFSILRLSLPEAAVRRIAAQTYQIVEQETQFLCATLYTASEVAAKAIGTCAERREKSILDGEIAQRAEVHAQEIQQRSLLEIFRVEESQQILRTRRARLLSPPPISPPPSPPPSRGLFFTSDPSSSSAAAAAVPPSQQTCRDKFFSQLSCMNRTADAVTQFCHKSFSLFFSIAFHHHFGRSDCRCGSTPRTSFVISTPQDLSDLTAIFGFGEQAAMVKKHFRILFRLEELLKAGRSDVTRTGAIFVEIPSPSKHDAIASWVYETLSFYDHHESQKVAPLFLSTSSHEARSSSSPYLIPPPGGAELAEEREAYFRRRTIFGFVPLVAIVAKTDDENVSLGFDTSWTNGANHSDEMKSEDVFLHELFTESSSLLRDESVDPQKAALIATAMLRRLLLIFCKLQKSKMCAEFYHCPLELLDRVPCLTQMCIVPKWTTSFCASILKKQQFTDELSWVDEVENLANGSTFFLGLLPPPTYQLLLTARCTSAASTSETVEPVADTVSLLAMAMLRSPSVPIVHDTARAVIDQIIRTAVESDDGVISGTDAQCSKSSPASLYRFAEDEIWAPLLRATKSDIQMTQIRAESTDKADPVQGEVAEISVNLLEALAARRRWHHMEQEVSPPEVFPFRASTGSAATAAESEVATQVPFSPFRDHAPTSGGSKTQQQQLQDKFDDLCKTPMPDQQLRRGAGAAFLTGSSSRRQRKFVVDSSPSLNPSQQLGAGKSKPASPIGRCCVSGDDKTRAAVQGILLATDHCGIFFEPLNCQVAGTRSQARLRAACPTHRSPFRVTAVDFVRNEMLMGRYQRYRDALVQSKKAHAAANRSPFLVPPVDELTSLVSPGLSERDATFCPALSARFLLESLHDFDSVRFPLVGGADDFQDSDRGSFVNEVVLLMGTSQEGAVQIVSEGLSYSDHRRTLGGIVSSYTQQNPVKPGYHFSNTICHAHSFAKPVCPPPTPSGKSAAEKENASNLAERVLIVFRVVLGNAVLTARNHPSHATTVIDSAIVGDATGHCDFVVTHRDAALPIMVVHYTSN